MNELARRSLVGAVLIATALVAAVVSGYPFAVLVALAACAMFFELRRMVAGWGLGWQLAGFVYALVPALALLWIRDQAQSDGHPFL